MKQKPKEERVRDAPIGEPTGKDPDGTIDNGGLDGMEPSEHAPFEYATKTMVCTRFGEEIVVLGKTKQGEYVVVGVFTDGKAVFVPTGVGIELSDMEELLEMQRHFFSGV